MRRKDREITDIKERLEIIEACKICRIGTVDEEGIYIVPMNFGYKYENDLLTLYVHSAKAGRKVEAFSNHTQVAVEMDYKHGLVEAERACEYGYSFRSIIGNGEITLVEDVEEKIQGLSLLMKHQTGKIFAFGEKEAKMVRVYKIEVRKFTGKSCN